MNDDISVYLGFTHTDLQKFLYVLHVFGYGNKDAQAFCDDLITGKLENKDAAKAIAYHERELARLRSGFLLALRPNAIRDECSTS